MAKHSTIEWTETTWNPVTGCTKVSAGCTHCYAERMALRLQAMGQANYAHGFNVTLHERMLEAPISWRKPQTVFVNSMSDLFHESVPDAFILAVFEVMKRADWHRFQVLTKRSGRMAEMSGRLPWPGNVWMGVTVESAQYLHRLDDLRRTNAAVKFCSMEPLLGPMPTTLNLADIGWVIVGGESGPGARPMAASWARQIRDACQAQGTTFFFKQWGGFHKKKAGCMLDGKEWKEYPAAVSQQAFA
jgi:protein gp37